jgi:hypothetical protein
MRCKRSVTPKAETVARGRVTIKNSCSLGIGHSSKLFYRARCAEKSQRWLAFRELGRSDRTESVSESLLGIPEQFCIEEVLRARSRQLVSAHRRTTDEANGDRPELAFDGFLIRLSKCDSRDRRQDVDPPRRKAELINVAGLREILLGHTVRGDRRTEREQCTKDALRIDGRWLDQKIDIASGPWETMGRERVSADHQEDHALR